MSERRRLGAAGRTLLGLGVVLAMGLVSAVAREVYLTEKVTAHKATITRERLALWAKFAKQRHDPSEVDEDIDEGIARLRVAVPWPSADGTGEDRSGQESLLGKQESLELDAWGQPFLYRCPGPIHRHGWDLYSVGPNGLDEHGAGDDILVGEDVAEVESSR